MPKSKVSHNQIHLPSSSSRTPVKIGSTGTPMWYKILILVFMLAGLAWIVVYYLAAPHIPFMQELGPWNFGIAFGLFIIGLLMTMGWR